jgi:hypothetical protein
MTCANSLLTFFLGAKKNQKTTGLKRREQTWLSGRSLQGEQPPPSTTRAPNLSLLAAGNSGRHRESDQSVVIDAKIPCGHRS